MNIRNSYLFLNISLKLYTESFKELTTHNCKFISATDIFLSGQQSEKEGHEIEKKKHK